MTGAPALVAADIPERLRHDLADDVLAPARRRERTQAFVATMLKQRGDFGITRVGSITRLDGIGMPVVQVVRPLALSNAVSQGKGADFLQAAASALMETLETWAAERIAPDRVSASPARPDEGIDTLFAGCLDDDFQVARSPAPKEWIEGFDLLTERMVLAPLALVDTVYTLPSPHPAAFARSTTGLAGGTSLLSAVIHAALEILEKDAVAAASRRPHFFDHWRVDAASVDGPVSRELLDRIHAASLLSGIWLVPSGHDLPTYWCHVMEAGAGENEIVPLPAEGFGCALTHDEALSKALMEACQARLGAISGAREDITRQHYPGTHDRERIAAWQQRLRAPGRTIAFPREGNAPFASPLVPILAALRGAGARAAIVVPLFSRTEPRIEIVRIVAPPLRHGVRV